MKYKILTFLLNHSLSINKFIFNLFFAWLPVDENKIVLCSHKGYAGYGCNLKYITEEIIRQNLPYKLVWLTQQEFINNNEFPPQVKLVDIKNFMACLYELSTSKLWLDNANKMQFFKKGLEKKKDQKYLNTWHGSLGIKRIDFAAENFAKNKNFSYFLTKDINSLDIMLSNSEFENEVYKKSRHFNKRIEKIGHARNDIFFKNDEILKLSIKNKIGINKDTKILLYVPSFRDNLRIDCYNLNYERLRAILENKIGGQWNILSKFHPKLVNKIEYLTHQSEYQRDVSLYHDIQELLYISDAIISDYSSCMFDFMLTRKPCFIYAEDIEQYNNERGFYYPLEATPFPIAHNNKELEYNILHFDNEKYVKEVDKFLEEKNCVDDGTASVKAVNIIKQIMKQV